MFRRPHPDVWAGAIVAAAGLGYALASLKIPAAPSASSVLGPGAAPLAVGIALGAAGAALCAKGVRQRRPASDGDPADGDLNARPEAAEKPEPPRIDRRRFWAVVGLLIGYVVAFIPLGYLLATAGFLAALSMYLEPRRLRRNLVFAAALPICVYILFTHGLGVQLPTGVLGVG